VTGHASVIGTGVTLYLAGKKPGGIHIGGNVSLTPATTGVYKGIVFFQDPANHSADTLTGDLAISGVFYAPGARLTLSGRGNLADNADPADVIDALSVFSDVQITGHGIFAIDSASNTIDGIVT
jgi:hypothetical protein